MKLRLISLLALALVVALGAARAQVGQILPSGSLSSITGCAADTTLQARMDGGQNAGAITSAVCGMVADGTFAKLDGLYVFATNSEANAQLNWVQNAFNLTKTGTPAFSANNGYTGDGFGYFLTGFNPSTAGGQTALNGTSMAVCMNIAEAAATVYQFGANDSTNISALNAHGSSLFGGFVSSLNSQYFNFSITSNAAALAVVRTNSTTVVGYKNTSSVGNATKTSNALPNAEYAIFGLNTAGTVGNFSTKQLAWVYYGGLLTFGQVQSLYSRLHTYLVAVGATSAC